MRLNSEFVAADTVPTTSMLIPMFFELESYLVSGSMFDADDLQNCSVGGDVYSLYIRK